MKYDCIPCGKTWYSQHNAQQHQIVVHCRNGEHCIHTDPTCAADNRADDHEDKCCTCRQPLPFSLYEMIYAVGKKYSFEHQVFIAEWIHKDPDGSIIMAGVRPDGRAYIASENNLAGSTIEEVPAEDQ